MILALETATSACSAALCRGDGSLVAERVALDGPAHTQRLLPFVQVVLEEAGAGWADVDTVAVGLGPGAFTGLRIGVATARALAQADGSVRLAGVPTTAALALALLESAARGDEDVSGRGEPMALVPLIDGKRREVFASVYAADPDAPAGLRLSEEVTVVAAEDLRSWLAAHGPALVGGDAAVLYADRLPASARQAAGLEAPTAAMVGRAVACGAPGLVLGPGRVLPLYGRAPDAARWTGGGAR